MFTPEFLIAGVMLVALCIYLLTAGSDFGGGILDLLCSGKRFEEQRQLIATRIAPVWEANHVWLILILVLYWVCFPVAYRSLTTALFIPLIIMLIGIILRGASFIFRAHDLHNESHERFWSHIFGVASLISPFMLGVILGAISSGKLSSSPEGFTFNEFFIDPWLSPFPLGVGGLTVLICGFLSALYMLCQAKSAELKNDFRIRAFSFSLLVPMAAMTTFFLARAGAPHVYEGILFEGWPLILQICLAILALLVLAALALRKDLLAMLVGIVLVVIIVLGWGLLQAPYLIVNLHSISDSAASKDILVPVLIALPIGAVFLVPSLICLYWVFERD